MSEFDLFSARGFNSAEDRVKQWCPFLNLIAAGELVGLYFNHDLWPFQSEFSRVHIWWVPRVVAG